MNKITFGLRNFIKEVYKVDLEEVLSIDNFYFENVKYDTDENDYKKLNNFLNEANLKVDNLSEFIQNVMNSHYEYSYIDEYSEAVLNRIESKIEKDFSLLPVFFKDEMNDAKIKDGKLTVKIDWEKDTLVVTGKLSILELAVVECINGYGIFYYTLKDFKEEGNLTKRIKDHIHWLGCLEKIYGSIYNFFEINLDNIDRYNSLGNLDFTLEDVIMCYESL